MPVVLARSSAARRRLLRRLVADFEVVRPCVNEDGHASSGPQERTVKLARAKARQVAGVRPEALVIAADTVVVCQGEVVGKAAGRRDAVRILTKLTRSPHSVLTGLCVRTPDGRERSRCVEARLRMRPMSRPEIEQYVSRPGAMHRAGVYGLQEADPNVVELLGSPSAVMGLPLEDLRAFLCELYPEQGDSG